MMEEWNFEGGKSEAYFGFDHLVNLAKWTERGKLHRIFVTDHAEVREAN
ncbi:hypothetical protein [Paenibacillus taichungensis]